MTVPHNTPGDALNAPQAVYRDSDPQFPGGSQTLFQAPIDYSRGTGLRQEQDSGWRNFLQLSPTQFSAQFSGRAESLIGQDLPNPFLPDQDNTSDSEWTDTSPLSTYPSLSDLPSVSTQADQPPSVPFPVHGSEGGYAMVPSLLFSSPDEHSGHLNPAQEDPDVAGNKNKGLTVNTTDLGAVPRSPTSLSDVASIVGFDFAVANGPYTAPPTDFHRNLDAFPSGSVHGSAPPAGYHGHFRYGSGGHDLHHPGLRPSGQWLAPVALGTLHPGANTISYLPTPLPPDPVPAPLTAPPVISDPSYPYFEFGAVSSVPKPALVGPVRSPGCSRQLPGSLLPSPHSTQFELPNLTAPIDSHGVDTNALIDALVARISALRQDSRARNSETDQCRLISALKHHRQLIIDYCKACAQPSQVPTSGNQARGFRGRQNMKRIGCFECEKSYTSDQNLLKHLDSELRIKRIVCPDCGTRLAGDLPRHQSKCKGVQQTTPYNL